LADPAGTGTPGLLVHVRGVGIDDSQAVEAAIAEAGYSVGDMAPA
jgi:hypothetical protein